MNDVAFAFCITLLAGLSTGIGSLIAFVAKSTDRKFLSFSLGLSAGVMIYVSFMEILADAQERLFSAMGGKGEWLCIALFFVGIGFIALIDKLVPSKENPHEIKSLESMEQHPPKSKLIRLGTMTALAIGIHNFPEGLATFASALDSPTLGIAIGIAIAIHNIPEGIAVSVPVYQATGDRKKAFRLSFLSGLAEPIGAAVGYLILRPFLSPALLGGVLAVVAGIMVFISLDELLPAARELGFHHISIYGVETGMAVMAVSLTLLS